MSKARQLADLGNVYDDGALSNRNLIINGAMQVAQRGTSLTGVTSSGYKTVDRFKWGFSGPTCSFSQNAITSGDPYDLGFRSSNKVEITTAGTAATTDYMECQYFIEAADIAKSGWNYKDPDSYITLSFWAKSSLAGTYYTYQTTYDGTRYYWASAFTLQANTWKKVTQSIPGNANLTIDDNTDRGFLLRVVQYYGTNYTDPTAIVDAWRTVDAAKELPDYAQNFVGTLNATFEFTGVQLEQGDTATPFEHRSYGDELARCQRYYEKYGSGWAGDGGNQQVSFRVEKRSSPTMTVTQGSTAYLRTGGFRWDRAGDSTSEGYEADAEL